MTYSIICDARSGAGMGISTLALVDRRRQKGKWWTADSPREVLRLTGEDAAKKLCSRFTHNNARVVPTKEAIDMLIAQAADIALHKDIA